MTVALFERKDAELKFSRGKNAVLNCAMITVTWERKDAAPVVWRWTRVSAIKGICRAHWDGPCDAENESQIREYCHGAMKRIKEREEQDNNDPVCVFWRNLSDADRTKARREMDWDIPGDCAQQAYAKSTGN